jgi:Domain of unknown function (DUF4867)
MLSSRPMLHLLIKANPHLTFHEATELAGLGLGRLLEGISVADWVETLGQLEPTLGRVRYERSLPELETQAAFQVLQAEVFGGLPAQAGYCNGQNQYLNAFEYHQSSEVVVAATPLILLLDHADSIQNNKLTTRKTVGLFLQTGQAVELYARTLHCAPVQVQPDGFRSIIVLPRNTNLPLEPEDRRLAHDPLLFARNKWLISHPEGPPASRGGYIGIEGSNLRVHQP